ncbi:hypothetical protein ACFE04_016618 [Oxalis oulophora]
MGNCKSCADIMGGSSSCTGSRTAKLIDKHGKISNIKVPISVMEIMMNEPGYIVCAMDVILRTRWITGLNPNSEVLHSNLYVLVHASRANTMATDSELLGVATVYSRFKKRLISSSSDAKFEGFKVNKFEGHGMFKRSKWRPALEPIHEFFFEKTE